MHPGPFFATLCILIFSSQWSALPFPHIGTTRRCSFDASTSLPMTRVYVRGMSAVAGLGVARTVGDTLQVRRRGERAFIHGQVALARGSVKMGMASTVLIATDCKFMAVELPRACAFTLPYPLLTTPPSKLMQLGHKQPTCFYGADLFDLFGLCFGQRLCYSLRVTQLFHKCSNPWFVSCHFPIASPLHVLQVIGVQFPGTRNA